MARIQGRILLLVALPLLGVLALVAFFLIEANTRASAANELADDVGLTVLATDLVHELQRERGLSSGFVGSPDSSFDAVASQRQAADAARERFEVALANRPTRIADYAASTEKLSALAEHREGIQDRELNIAETLAPYTALIGDLLDASADLDDGAADLDARIRLASLDSLSRGKELSGLQRGFANGVVARGQFETENEHATYVQVAAGATTYLDQFVSNALTEDADLYLELVETPNEPSTALRLELDVIPPGEAISFEEDLWWDVMTDRIDRMRTIETTLADGLIDSSTATASSARNGLVAALFGALAFMALLIGLSYFLARGISSPLRSLALSARETAETELPETVEKIAAGESVELADPVELQGPTEIVEMSQSLNSLRSTAVDLASEQAQVRRNVSALFVNLGRRNQTLLNRQMSFIDQLERSERDPERLADMYKLDHLSTRIRRNAESLLVLAGADSPRRWSNPVPIGDVMRAATGEIEYYDRVDVQVLDEPSISGAAVSDVTHLLAELIENATSFSRPSSSVRVISQTKGEWLTILVVDEGLGMSDEELATHNETLANPTDVVEIGGNGQLGLHVVARLAARHNIAVQLAHNPMGGVVAQLMLSGALLGRPDVPQVGSGGANLSLGGQTEPTPVPAPLATASAPTTQFEQPVVETSRTLQAPQVAPAVTQPGPEVTQPSTPAPAQAAPAPAQAAPAPAQAAPAPAQAAPAPAQAAPAPAPAPAPAQAAPAPAQAAPAAAPIVASEAAAPTVQRGAIPPLPTEPQTAPQAPAAAQAPAAPQAPAAAQAAALAQAAQAQAADLAQAAQAQAAPSRPQPPTTEVHQPPAARTTPNPEAMVVNGVQRLRTEVPEQLDHSIGERRRLLLDPFANREAAGVSGNLPSRSRKSPKDVKPLAAGPDESYTPETAFNVLGGFAAGQNAANEESPHPEQRTGEQ